jgi:hypothetical protein
MVDGGAPHISLAAAEFERMTIHWQGQAKAASETAAYYTQLASALHEAYRHTIAESIRNYSHQDTPA